MRDRRGWFRRTASTVEPVALESTRLSRSSLKSPPPMPHFPTELLLPRLHLQLRSRHSLKSASSRKPKASSTATEHIGSFATMASLSKTPKSLMKSASSRNAPEPSPRGGLREPLFLEWLPPRAAPKQCLRGRMSAAMKGQAESMAVKFSGAFPSWAAASVRFLGSLPCLAPKLNCPRPHWEISLARRSCSVKSPPFFLRSALIATPHFIFLAASEHFSDACRHCIKGAMRGSILIISTTSRRSVAAMLSSSILRSARACNVSLSTAPSDPTSALHSEEQLSRRQSLSSGTSKTLSSRASVKFEKQAGQAMASSSAKALPSWMPCCRRSGPTALSLSQSHLPRLPCRVRRASSLKPRGIRLRVSFSI
mmetsp:Transcript_71223/g.154796  ORF Transcript_71223/g.154796 Transcript_71223/m.154796 type:complete len:367 (+) Transcript_71223:2290-3390(+)